MRPTCNRAIVTCLNLRVYGFCSFGECFRSEPNRSGMAKGKVGRVRRGPATVRIASGTIRHDSSPHLTIGHPMLSIKTRGAKKKPESPIRAS